jgi:phycocyanobilin lyase subunit beta
LENKLFSITMNSTIPFDKLLLAIDEASSATALTDAVKALAQSGLPEATTPLIKALGYNNPGAAVAAVDGLIQIGDAAVIPLLELLDNFNYGARAWAIRALAGIGNPTGLEVLLEAAKDDFALSVRRAAARGLGSIHWDGLSIERQVDDQSKCLDVLLVCAHDPEWVVRYAAFSAIQSLGTAFSMTQPHKLTHILEQLEVRQADESTRAVQARALLAQQRVKQLLAHAEEES